MTTLTGHNRSVTLVQLLCVATYGSLSSVFLFTQVSMWHKGHSVSVCHRSTGNILML